MNTLEIKTGTTSALPSSKAVMVLMLLGVGVLLSGCAVYAEPPSPYGYYPYPTYYSYPGYYPYYGGGGGWHHGGRHWH